MALLSKANFKTEIDTAAAALTTAYKDSVDTKVAGKIYHPSHPLRQFAKLFSFNLSTGVIAKNTAYIDEAYDNNAVLPVGSPFDSIAMPTAVLSTQTVETAAKRDIVLTYSMVLDATMDVAELKKLYTVGGDANPAKTIVSVAFSTTKVTITVNTDYGGGDTITLTYLGTGAFQIKADIVGNPVLALAAQAITNNV